MVHTLALSHTLKNPVSVPLRHTLSASMVAFYLLMKFYLMQYLPAKFFIDSGKLLEMVGGEVMDDNSFAVTARLFGLIPHWSHDLVILGIGILCIVLTFNAVRTWGGVVAATLIIPPLLVLGIMVPTKETLVLLMALALVLAAISGRIAAKPYLLIPVVTLLYAAYGLYVRDYYLLILAVWMAFLILPSLSRNTVVGLFAVSLMGMFLLPSGVFEALQGPRDQAYYVSEYVLQSNNRTSFANLFEPNSAFAFIGNYLYAVILLHFPFFKFFSANEVVLFTNVVVYGWLVISGWRSTNVPARMLAQLFTAHVVILMLFEPDLGSYFRHFSSVYPLLILAFASAEAVRVRTTAHHA